MVIRQFLLITVLFSLVTSFSAQALTKLTAKIDRNPVMTGESFTLTVEADDKLASSALDLSVLENQFMVVNNRTGSQTQIINGSISQATTWTVTLLQRKAGNYTIPAFTINNISTNPIQVQVIKPTKSQGNEQKVFLKTTVDRDTVYLQGSIQYTTKLYWALEMQSGVLSEPEMENATITAIGKDQNSSEIINGVRYHVLKRVYSITPQRSGDYTIAAPTFNGDVVISQRRSFFSGFNNTKSISTIGDDINITVRPIPDNYDGQWLPSDLVTLHEEWQPANGPYKVGDPITRVITLTAIGVSEEQLPEVQVEYPTSVKTYPDQSEAKSATRQDKMIAQRVESVAIIPNQAGQITLPEIKLPWWNTRTNRIEYAQLPAKTLNIEASDNSPIAPPVQAATPQVPQSNNPTQQPQIQTETIEVNSKLTWGFLAAWLTTLLAWAIHVRQLKQKGLTPVKANQQPQANDQNSKQHFAQFKAACNNNDAKAANSALLHWARNQWPQQNFTNSLSVAQFLNSQTVIDALEQLQTALYGANDGQWQGKDLLTAVEKNKTPQGDNHAKGLNPLHPA